MSHPLIAVIPAAGLGTRLGLDTPKLFAELRPGLRISDVLLGRLTPLVDHVHLVLSPRGQAHYLALGSPAPQGLSVSTSIQQRPLGMGDAVFGASSHWADYASILVLWGDQLGVSPTTLSAVAQAQRASEGPHITIPLVSTVAPYVHYDFDNSGALIRVLQSREGDLCPPVGRADVGLFAFSVDGALDAFQAYQREPGALGASTRELNLLPYFAYLSGQRGWPVQRIEVADVIEARGVNTPDDLAYFQAQRSR